MASIAKRPSGKWRARYRNAAGREHARHFERKIDAQWWLNEGDGEHRHQTVRRSSGPESHRR